VTTHRLEELEKKRPREVTEKEEKLAVDRHFREYDRKLVDDIDRKFGRYIPRSRMGILRQGPIRYFDHNDYVKHLREKGIEPTDKRRRIVGYVENGVIYVDRDHNGRGRTLAHERLHQASDRLYHAMLGERIYEGTTEHFASRLSPDLHIANEPQRYPEERRIVDMLSARVGDDALAKAYFRGDWIGLRSQIDAQLGEGALAKIGSLAEQRRFAEPEEIIKKGL
jgi:hypothetical protein